MKKTWIVVLALTAIAFGQSGTKRSQGKHIGAGYSTTKLPSVGTGSFPDFTFPDFTLEGLPPLVPPQLTVDPLAPFAQTVTVTKYMGLTAGSCSANGGTCDYTGGNAAQTALTAWCAAPDQRWNVIFHPGTYSLGSGVLTLCTKFNATKWIVFSSDSPLPRGRQACSHGTLDQFTPALPNMGYRNHKCNGATLGVPLVSDPLPITPTSAGYFSDTTNYNDIAHMMVLTSTGSPSTGGQIITTGPAHFDSTTNCPFPGNTGSHCPDDGNNHIVFQDTGFLPDPTVSSAIHIVSLDPVEWQAFGPLLPAAWAKASVHDVGFDEDYWGSDADDDGFSNNQIAAYVQWTCGVTRGPGDGGCWINHSYFDDGARNGSEDHCVSMTSSIGPTQFSNNRVNGCAIAVWEGGGGLPLVSDSSGNGVLTSNAEQSRNRLDYLQRWLPSNDPGNGSSAGVQTVKISTICAVGTKNACIDPAVTSCSAGVLTIGFLNNVSASNGIYNQVFYVSKFKVGTTLEIPTDLWVAANAAIAYGNGPFTASGTSCSNFSTGTLTSATVYGFGVNVNVTSAAAMNTCTFGAAHCNPANMNPVAKNRREAKEGQSFWVDGEWCQNSGGDGQEGQCYDSTVRAYSDVSKGTGGETQAINDHIVTNSVVAHSNQILLAAARSANHHMDCWQDATGVATKCLNPVLQSVTCDGSGNNATIVFDNNLSLLNPDYATIVTGTDIYLTRVAPDGHGGLLSMPNGWYVTQKPSVLNGGSGSGGYLNTVVATGTGICTAGQSTTVGTIWGPGSGGNGNGVTTGTHNFVWQNILGFDIGDHTNWNGSGLSYAFLLNGGGSNFSVDLEMGPVVSDSCGTVPVGVACAHITAIDACPAAKDCPTVIQAELNDLAYIQCAGNTAFSTGPLPIGTASDPRGQPMLSLDPGQTWFTYVPNNGSLPVGGATASCPLATPDQTTENGFYNNQSYPKAGYYNHITFVGESGMDVAGAEFQSNMHFKNSLFVTPCVDPSVGCTDVAPTNIGRPRKGFSFGTSDTFSTSDATGITNGGDRSTLTFENVGIGERTLANYPSFILGVGPGSTSSYSTTMNSVPLNGACTTSTVKCGGLSCSSLNYNPDCAGFIGAMSTTAFPLNLVDPRLYALDPSSPYAKGGILQAHDADGSTSDTGVNIPTLLNAFARTIRPCPAILPATCGPLHRDGPQYGWLTWTATAGSTNYRVYRDGSGSPTATVTTIFYQDYGLTSGSHSWVVKSWNGSIETVVSGLTTTIY